VAVVRWILCLGFVNKLRVERRRSYRTQFDSLISPPQLGGHVELILHKYHIQPSLDNRPEEWRRGTKTANGDLNRRVQKDARDIESDIVSSRSREENDDVR